MNNNDGNINWTPSNSTKIQLFNKHFFQGLNLIEIQTNSLIKQEVGNVISSGTIGGLDIGWLMDNAITLDTNQNVYAKLNFHDKVYLERVENFRTINNHDRLYFESLILKTADPIHIYGHKVVK